MITGKAKIVVVAVIAISYFIGFMHSSILSYNAENVKSSLYNLNIPICQPYLASAETSLETAFKHLGNRRYNENNRILVEELESIVWLEGYISSGINNTAYYMWPYIDINDVKARVYYIGSAPSKFIAMEYNDYSIFLHKLGMAGINYEGQFIGDFYTNGLLKDNCLEVFGLKQGIIELDILENIATSKRSYCVVNLNRISQLNHSYAISGWFCSFKRISI